MKRGKPSVEDIIALDKKLEDDIYGQLFTNFEEEQAFYELDFKDRLTIPTQFKSDRVVLPTARDMVDAFCDHVDISNARVYVPRKGTSQDAIKEAEEMEKFYTGLIYMTNVSADISPWRIAAKHYALHGMAVFKTVWDKDKDGLQIVIQPVHPRCIKPDPSYSGQMFVIEKHKQIVMDMSKRFPKWKNPKGKDPDEEVEYISYWDKDFRCDLIDKEPILKNGVEKHDYGFIPYIIIDSGLGNISHDLKPEMRYVGILRYMEDLLLSESLNYSLCDILMKRETMKGGYITGADAGDVKDVKQEYGKYWPVGNKDVQFHDWETKLAPDAAYAHLALTHDYISAHAAPRSLRGLSETGVRSGADRRLVISEALARYRYSEDAFKYRTAQVLINCAKLYKNVVPNDVRVYSGVPNMEFDEIIKKDKVNEPFNCYVEFAPISEEDEYRRHDDLKQLVASGIITRPEARRQISNLDPVMLSKEEKKDMFRQAPAYAEFLNQLIQAKTQEALGGMQINRMPMTAMPQGGQGSPRRIIPQIPKRAVPGSAEDLQNQLKGMKSQVPISPTQGQGGGGNRY